MNISNLIENDIKQSLAELKKLRLWLELNIENLSLKEFQKVWTEVEKMEIAVEIRKELT